MYHEEYASAYESFDRALKTAPRLAPALNNWGNALLRDVSRDDNYVEAAKKFEAAFALDSKLTRAKASGLYAQGMQHKYNDEYREAVKKFEQAVAIDPDFADAHQDWGVSLEELCAADGVTVEEQTRLAEAAIRQYELAIELDPETKFPGLSPMIKRLRRGLERARAGASPGSVC